MRKVALCLGISIDGYIARRDHTFDFLFLPEDYSMQPFFDRIDTAFLGRKTWEVTKEFGPPGSGEGTRSFVFSHRLEPGEREGVIVTRESPEAIVERLRREPGKDMWLMGGGELVRHFLREDLVDELYLGIVPTLLGDGIPLFPAGFPQRDFRLVGHESFSRGLVTLRYERSR